jgi:hypothetical protein
MKYKGGFRADSRLGTRKGVQHLARGEIAMPQVDESGNPVTDDPTLDDEDQRGGDGRGPNVNASQAPGEGTGVSTGPNEPREAQPGATQGEGGNLGGSDASGSAG